MGIINKTETKQYLTIQTLYNIKGLPTETSQILFYFGIVGQRVVSQLSQLFSVLTMLFRDNTTYDT